jgi:ribosomal peptide maturation radical SAM protein 1
MPRVSLVQMPYGALQRPSIALGLLKAALERSDIACQVVYGNLAFAEEIGAEVYLQIEQSSTAGLLGEWTFGAAAFPGFSPDPDAYFAAAGGDLVSAAEVLLRKLHPGVELRALYEIVREHARGFVARLADRILETKPAIVGCSSIFQQHCASLALLRVIREKAPGVITLLGGANCEGAMGRATHRHFPWVDYVVSGEADGLIAELCGQVLARGRELKLEEIPDGVFAPAQRSGPRERGAARPVLADLDRAEVPDYSDYFAALQRSPLGAYVVPSLPVETSRGCWWGEKSHCTFCGLNGLGMTHRAKTPERALRELDTLATRHGVERMMVVDNILDMRYFRSVLPALADRGAPYKLFYEVKANLRRDQLEQLALSGVRWLQPGLEHLHDGVLELLRKGTTALQNVRMLKWSRELGVRLTWAILHGAPGEHDAWYSEIAELVPLLVHLQPPSGTPKIRYDRFSPYHSEPARFGLQLRPKRVYSLIYPLAESELAELAYFFDDEKDLVQPPRSLEDDRAQRPGLHALVERVEQWRALFWRRSGAPMLSARAPATPGAPLLITDTRPIAAERSVALHGLCAEILDACDGGLSREQLSQRLGPAGGSAPERAAAVSAALAELVARKLVVELSGRFLSLALREPWAEYPLAAECPEGTFHIADLLARGHARSALARRAQESPFAQSIGELFGPPRLTEPQP